MTIKTNYRTGRARSRFPGRKPNGAGVFDIILQASGVDLSNALREAAALKIGRVRKFAPNAFRARVQFERDHKKAPKDQYRAAVRFEVPGCDIVAEHRAPEPMTALGLVAEKIERRLRKRKTAGLARRAGRAARALRIGDLCGLHEDEPLQRR